MSVDCANGLFGEGIMADGLSDLEGRGTISQGDLISFLWKESVGNFVKAKKWEDECTF